MNFDITPSTVIDLTELGICKTFDHKSAPGFVNCYFEDGQVLKLRWEKFVDCRFRIADDAGLPRVQVPGDFKGSHSVLAK